MEEFTRGVSMEDFSPGDLKKVIPVARVRRVMKAHPDVRMIGSDSTVVLVKAVRLTSVRFLVSVLVKCELFIRDLTLRAMQAGNGSLSSSCLAHAIQSTEYLQFLAQTEE